MVEHRIPGSREDRAEACSALLLPHCGVFRLSSSALGLSQDMPQSPGLVWGARVTHPPKGDTGRCGRSRRCPCGTSGSTTARPPVLCVGSASPPTPPPRAFGRPGGTGDSQLAGGGAVPDGSGLASCVLGGGTVARPGEGEPPGPLAVGLFWGGGAAGRTLSVLSRGMGRGGARAQRKTSPALAAFRSRKCKVGF